MAKIWITEYTVTGRGRFPVDMLRYDASYPSANASEIFDRDEGLLPMERVIRSVKLHHRDAYSKWEPTADRWASFGWYVVKETIRGWSL